jgi:hypothetical protein
LIRSGIPATPRFDEPGYEFDQPAGCPPFCVFELLKPVEYAFPVEYPFLWANEDVAITSRATSTAARNRVSEVDDKVRVVVFWIFIC